MSNMLQQFAMNLLSNNPCVKNNPQAQMMIQAIQNDDNITGEQIAMNICRSYGIEPDQAIKDARNFFKI